MVELFHHSVRFDSDHSQRIRNRWVLVVHYEKRIQGTTVEVQMLASGEQEQDLDIGKRKSKIGW